MLGACWLQVCMSREAGRSVSVGGTILQRYGDFKEIRHSILGLRVVTLTKKQEP